MFDWLVRKEKLDELRDAGQFNAESGWTKIAHGEQTYYMYDRGGKELSLELPAEGVKDVRVSGTEEFERQLAGDRPERQFARAQRMDELRDAGQFNPESEWTKVIHGERAYYGRGGEWGKTIPRKGNKPDRSETPRR